MVGLRDSTVLDGDGKSISTIATSTQDEANCKFANGNLKMNDIVDGLILGPDFGASFANDEGCRYAFYNSLPIGNKVILSFGKEVRVSKTVKGIFIEFLC